MRNRLGNLETTECGVSIQKMGVVARGYLSTRTATTAKRSSEVP